MVNVYQDNVKIRFLWIRKANKRDMDGLLNSLLGIDHLLELHNVEFPDCREILNDDGVEYRLGNQRTGCLL